MAAVLLLLPVSVRAQSAPETTPSTNESVFRKLFTTLGRDLKQFGSKDSIRILVDGGLITLAAVPFDEDATLRASSSPFLKRSYSGAGKALGREWVQGGVALGTYLGGLLLDRPGMVKVGGDLIEAQLVSLTVTQGLKFATHRTRPDGEDTQSFPSGHASAAFATASVLQRHFGRKVAIAVYAVAVFTSSSRLQANSHYASDVIFGATLGIVAGRIATLEVANARLRVTPVPVPGGVAVMVSRR